MKPILIIISVIATILIMLVTIWLLIPMDTNEPTENTLSSLVGDRVRGEDLLSIAGCFACHTDIESGLNDFAGGPALDSPFGTFYASNITPDKRFGIGTWTLFDFERAVRQGISPDNQIYYPSMPYTAYNGLSDQDVVDLWVAIQKLEPVTVQSKPHLLSFPFNQRKLLKLWRSLYFPTFSGPTENRGEYLVKHVLHCSECHTPRNFLGGQQLHRFLQGNPNLPGDNSAPNISKDRLYSDGWTSGDIDLVLSIGMMLDGDFVSGSMAEVVDYGTALLTKEDILAVTTYLSE